MRAANTRRERMKGLLGRDGLEAGEMLLIPNCRSVHTFGMRFTIKVAFLDGDYRVLEVIRLAPGRITRPRLRARHVLECAEGREIHPGDLV